MPPEHSPTPDGRRPRRAVRYAKRTAVATAGGTLLAGGAAMLVLPGPGLLVIAAGLAVLATEFAWAERRLEQVREQARSAANKVPRRRRSTTRRSTP
jgi:hypothetical protein